MIYGEAFMQKEQKLFAFKLADKDQKSEKNTKWKAREGVAIAGCTQWGHIPDNVRYSDNGYYC